MKYSPIVHNNYVDVEFYKHGVIFALLYSDQILYIGLPFFIIEIKTYMFLPNKRLKMGDINPK
jgi:hypothetical protein